MKTKLLHRTVEVRLVDHIEPDEGEGFNYGSTTSDNGTTVSVSNAIKDDADLVDTVLHEFMHAVDFTCGLELPHYVVFSLAAGLSQMLIELKLIHPPTWRAQLASTQKLEVPDAK